MFVRLSFKNYLSVCDQQDISLVASTGSADYGFAPAQDVSTRILPVALIYGANGAGKSNAISALRFFIRSIVHSHSRLEPDEEIPRRPFALRKDCVIGPSEFEADVYIAGIRYQYGFGATNESFETEWLISYANGKRSVLFSRSKGNLFSFSRLLKGPNKLISELTRKNSLFLSAAAQNNHDIILPIYKFFREVIIHDKVFYSGMDVDMFYERMEPSTKVIKFLELANSGICGFKKTSLDVDDEKKVSEISKVLQTALESISDSEKPKLEFRSGPKSFIQFLHKADVGEVPLKITSESAGTRRLLVLLQKVFDSLKRGSLLVVDEIDSSIHTQLTTQILSLFVNKQTNPDGAQIIATCHDTNILANDDLHRDEFWFAEKDEAGKTSYIPLSDFKVRASDNFEKGYLEGRFGAVPLPGSISNVFGEDE